MTTPYNNRVMTDARRSQNINCPNTVSKELLTLQGHETNKRNRQSCHFLEVLKCLCLENIRIIAMNTTKTTFSLLAAQWIMYKTNKWRNISLRSFLGPRLRDWSSARRPQAELPGPSGFFSKTLSCSEYQFFKGNAWFLHSGHKYDYGSSHFSALK